MILHLIETGGPGGAEQMLLRLAEKYRCRGLEQVIILRKTGWLETEVKKRGFECRIVPLNRRLDLAWLRQMVRYVRTGGITSIHAHEFTMNFHGAILGLFCNIPVVSTVHGKGYYLDKVVRKLIYAFVSRASNMVAVSEDIRQNLLKNIRFVRKNITLIQNGLDCSEYSRTIGERNLERARLGVRDSDFLVVSVGSYYEVKGHKFLIEAASILLGLGRKVKIVVAGQGPMQTSLFQLATSLGIVSEIELVGYVEDIPSLLSAADCYVMPSLSEGIPLALLEASASGCAIVASDVGGIPEVIKNDVNGLLVLPQDSKQIARAISALMDNEELRCRLGKQARVTIMEDWSLDSAVDAYLRFLEVEKSVEAMPVGNK